jgi:hypothetical protein
MKIYKQADLSDTGDTILIYGATGVGKSVSVLQSAPEPIFYFMVEPRNPLKFLEASGRTNIDVDFAFYTNWEDMFDWFMDSDNTKRYNSIVIDSLTFLSNIALNFELIDESFDSKTDKEKDKILISRTKLSMEGFGGLSGQLLRFTNLISKLSQSGKAVILIALLEQNPKFNRTLVGAPCLKGRDYPKTLPGFCDFIGLVESNTDENGLTIYPPMINFKGDEGYMSKWTGYGAPARGPLHISKILDRAHGRTEKGGNL